MQSKEQKQELKDLFKNNKKIIQGVGKIDYVAGWYFKGAQYISNTDIQVGYVSTSSITQGEQVD